MKDAEQYFHVVLFIILDKVVLTFKYVTETLVHGHLYESYWSWAVLSCGTVYYDAQGGSNFRVCKGNPVCGHLNESYWAVLSCGTVYYDVQGGSNF